MRRSKPRGRASGLLKKTHMLRCARPISRQRTRKVRLRSSTFACLASEIFLSSQRSAFFSKLNALKKIASVFMSPVLCRSVLDGAAVLIFVLGVPAASLTIAAGAGWQKEWEKKLEAAQEKRENRV